MWASCVEKEVRKAIAASENQQKAETWSFGFKVQHPDPLVKYDLMDVGPWLVRVSCLGPHH